MEAKGTAASSVHVQCRSSLAAGRTPVKGRVRAHAGGPSASGWLARMSRKKEQATVADLLTVARCHAPVTGPAHRNLLLLLRPKRPDKMRSPT